MGLGPLGHLGHLGGPCMTLSSTVGRRCRGISKVAHATEASLGAGEVWRRGSASPVVSGQGDLTGGQQLQSIWARVQQVTAVGKEGSG